MKIKTPILLLFILFFGIHIALININYTEWGDSFNILRASQAIKNFDYPEDEKRPPLFSIILSICSENNAINCSRVIILIISLLSFVFFYLLVEEILKNSDERTKYLSLILFIFNPVYLYWSIRVMTDVLLATINILAVLLAIKWNKKLSAKKILILSFLCFLAILTRFEGYILAFAMVCYLTFGNEIKKVSSSEIFKSIKGSVQKNLSNISIFLISLLVLLAPYILLRNPFKSSYLNEPLGRSYSYLTLWEFIASLMFVLGFLFPLYLKIKNPQVVKDYFKNNLVIGVLVITELVLILCWPAAIPRLFMAIVAFLIIPTAKLITEFFDKSNTSYKDLFLLLGILAFYILSQYKLRQQFLIVDKGVFALVVIVSLLQAALLFAKKEKIFLVTLFSTCILWSFSIIYSHKDIYKTIVDASNYAYENIDGTIGYTYLNGVSNWYLREKSCETKIKKVNQVDTILNPTDCDYILTSEELWKDGDINLPSLKNSYFVEKEFKSKINGKEFSTKIIRLEE